MKIPALKPYSLTPYSRNGCAAEFALSIHYIILFYKIPYPLYKHLLALWAEGAFTFMPDIANINKFQPHIHCRVSCISKCLQRCRRQIIQFIIGHKPREMDRDIRPKIFQYPPAHLFDSLRIIIQCWYNKICYLKPYALLL